MIIADKKVIVIGGGITGLASGIYAQANGWDTTVFEMHTTPGGLCTSWEQTFYGGFDGQRRKRVLVKIIGE